MRKYGLICLLLGCNVASFSQTTCDNVPIHTVQRAFMGGQCVKYESKASIDSPLWSDFLNTRLYTTIEDRKIPNGVYKIPVQFVVDTAGKIMQAKALAEDPLGLGLLIKNTLNAFPYKWSPATQNGRPVKSYHKMILIFDTGEN